MNFAKCRQVAHKINGKVETKWDPCRKQYQVGEEKEIRGKNIMHYKVIASPMEDKTVKQWNDEKAAAANPETPKAMEPEMMMAADDKKEGDENMMEGAEE